MQNETKASRGIAISVVLAILAYAAVVGLADTLAIVYAGVSHASR